MNHSLLTGSVAVLALAMCAATPAQDLRSRAKSHSVAGFPQGRYFLVPPRETPSATDTAPGVLVVLPGGDGGPEFLTFVENTILASPAASRMVGVVVTAPRWSDVQETPWPTQDVPVERMRYTTESLVTAVIDDLRRQIDIDHDRIFLFAWGSSGRAALRLTTGLRSDFAGAYLAMASYQGLPQRLTQCKGRRFVIDHSTGDRIHPHTDAVVATERLVGEGALAWLRTTRGGHGWTDTARAGIDAGIAWLTSTQAVPTLVATVEPTAGRQLLSNGSFEGGIGGWDAIDNSGTLEIEVDETSAIDGERCVHVKKTGKITSDSLRQQISLEGLRTVQVALRVKSKSANAFQVAFLMHAPDGQVLADDTEVAAIEADRDWHWVIRDFKVPAGAKFATLMVSFGLDGEIWLDDVRVLEPARAVTTSPTPGK
jgi:predicted esterase